MLIVHTVFQTLGGAFSVSSGQSAFVNRLLATLPKTAPNADPAFFILCVDCDLHNTFSPEVLPGVLRAYMVGLKVRLMGETSLDVSDIC